jgi:hypothetical protein
MKKQITTKDKLSYLKRKMEDEDVPADERLEIVEFFLQSREIIGNKKLDIEVFFKELNRLTGCKSPIYQGGVWTQIREKRRK